MINQKGNHYSTQKQKTFPIKQRKKRKYKSMDNVMMSDPPQDQSLEKKGNYKLKNNDK